MCPVVHDPRIARLHPTSGTIMSHFACKLCEGRRDLLDLAGELCDDCMVCFPCAAAHLQAQVNRQLSPPSWPPILRGLHKPHEYSKGEHVLYRQQQVWRPAQVVQVDRSVHPPQLGIVLEPVQGQDANVRYTEFDRLRPLNEPALYDIPKGNANQSLAHGTIAHLPCTCTRTEL